MKEVNQFPSDIECMRYIATIADKVNRILFSTFYQEKRMLSGPLQINKCVCFLQELLKKCHQCMETIVKAKDQQAAEANKNASILLKELDLEKVTMDDLSCLKLLIA